MTLRVLLPVRSSLLQGEGWGMAVMGLLAFTSEEKIGKKLNSSEMATKGTGGPLYNMSYLQKVSCCPQKSSGLPSNTCRHIPFHVLRMYAKLGYQLVISV